MRFRTYGDPVDREILQDLQDESNKTNAANKAIRAYKTIKNIHLSSKIARLWLLRAVMTYQAHTSALHTTTDVMKCLCYQSAFLHNFLVKVKRVQKKIFRVAPFRQWAGFCHALMLIYSCWKTLRSTAGQALIVIQN